MAAYSEMYLNEAMANLGEAVEYAVKGCGMDMDVFFGLFLSSGIAAQFEKGNPKYVSGMSGTELVLEIMNKANYRVNVPEAAKEYEATPEYWCGWILAYYQWRSGMIFRKILKKVKAETLLRMYVTLHEAPEEKALDTLDGIMQTLFDEDFKIQQRDTPRFRCDCSRERIDRALIAMGYEELKKMRDEDNGADLWCNFCNTTYHYSGEQLDNLLETMRG